MDNSDVAKEPVEGSGVTKLPIVVSTMPGTVKIIDDADQAQDHSHRPIEPVTDEMLPFRYKVRLDGANAYASTADEVLALFVVDHDPAPNLVDDHDGTLESEQIRVRGRHAATVIKSWSLQAAMTGQIPQEDLGILDQAVPGQGPVLTSTECPVWEHDVPLVLLGDVYDPTYGKYTPPAGNVVFVFAHRAEKYLDGLAQLGMIMVEENPIFRAGPQSLVATD